MAGKIKQCESENYASVESFLKKRFGCFVTTQNKGTTFGRVDVVGIRDIGGDLAGAVEIITVEVKTGNQPFNTAVGQAYSYSVYADRCYLADCRVGAHPFVLEEIDIASKLGVGLLAIRPNGNISEILASPQHTPLIHMRAKLIEKLRYAQCTVCGSIFQRGDEKNWAKYVSSNIKNALKQERGLVYWLEELGERKDRSKRKYNYERRYICSDCIWYLYHEILPQE
jgi:hypothetical protein